MSHRRTAWDWCRWCLLLAVVVTVGIGTAVVRRSPPSREAAVAAGRRHAGPRARRRRPARASWPPGYVGATQLGNGAPGGLGVTALLIPITFGVVHSARAGCR